MRHDSKFCPECRAFPVSFERQESGMWKCLHCWAVYTQDEVHKLPNQPARREADRQGGHHAGTTTK